MYRSKHLLRARAPPSPLSPSSHRPFTISQPAHALAPRHTTGLPPNYPQLNFLNSVSQVAGSGVYLVKWLLISTASIGVIGLVAFEGVHQYVERFCLASPSRGDDEWGWEDEVQGWTGGKNGGTDPRLGFKGRHSVRAAWMCQNWGIGGAQGVSGQAPFEPDSVALKSMIRMTSRPPPVDRGYEYADEYLNVAITAARAKGLEFPSKLSAVRPAGPPKTLNSTKGDPTAIDLLLLRAGILERVSTFQSQSHAKELYQQVFCATPTATQQARAMRLARKIGDLCARLGNGSEAMTWWSWGLSQVGLDKKEPDSTQLSPVILRATISLLTSASTHCAQSSQLETAKNLQTTALSLLPAPQTIPSPTDSTAAMILHDTWLQQRSSLLVLHLASVTHALHKPALNLATTGSSRAEAILSAIDPIPSQYTRASSPLHQPSKHLHRDALLTAAEASYTRGVLLERQSNPQLDLAASCFERAMNLNAQESGKTKEDGMGADWEKYWTSFARVKSKLGEPVDQPVDDP